MKIGIISEFRLDNVNYGNNLQAYALNTYLKDLYPDASVDILLFRKYKKRRRFYLGILVRKICLEFVKLADRKERLKNSQLIRKRREGFEKFRRETMNISCREMDWKTLTQSDYDVLVVGSDVVWVQDLFTVNRVKFLDFPNSGYTRKVSYAASFGKDWIPRCNRSYLRKCLKDFYGISVREKSSVDLLKSIGIENAVHTLDPTLLINADKWKELERKPKLDVGKNEVMLSEDKAYIFAYLLSDNESQRREIMRIARANELNIITIPFANGKWNQMDEQFGDIKLVDCSPSEWIWLIHHAELIVTDSFHGIVFSTIFSRKFLAVRRCGKQDINNRQKDYLNTIHQEDKLVDLSKVYDLNRFRWNQDDIEQQLEKKRRFSYSYIAGIFCDDSRCAGT